MREWTEWQDMCKYPEAYENVKFSDRCWAYCKECVNFGKCPLKPTLACSLKEVKK